MKLKVLLDTTFVLSVLFLFTCANKQSDIQFSKKDGKYIFESKELKIDFDQQMRCNVYRKKDDKLLSFIKEENIPHYLVINDTAVMEFTVDDKRLKISEIDDEFGPGKRLTLVGAAAGPLGSLIEKTLTIDLHRQFPQAAILSAEYRNVQATQGLFIDKEVDNSFKLDASLINKKYNKHAFWILQGGSYHSRPDWINPVTDDFSFDNYQGQRIETEAVGGGLPVLDVWNKETGFFIGSIRGKPTLISLPARVDQAGCLDISIQYERNHLEFNDVYKSIPMVVGVHSGDFYNGLRSYSDIMAAKGFKMIQPDSSDPVYGAEWCGWGLGPDFEPQKMIDMIPVLKEMNFKVVTVDLGWFYHNGDLVPRDDRFPNGDADMRKFVKAFHDNGLLIDLWITPSVAGSDLKRKHPEWLIKDKNGNFIVKNSYGSKIYYLCPALKKVRDYHREFVKKSVGDWGFDGFKMDQSLINAASSCYAKDHNHAYPEESFEALPEIYKIIYKETFKVKTSAVVEVCPCGMFPSFYKMPYYNLPVASDPKSQWQIRHRGKTLKALMGPHAAYFGDHVERYYKESNFPSMIGVGGIPGTMFVLKPEDNAEFLRVKYPGYLSPERKVHFKKWLDIYNKYELASGEYLNLYDIAYDKPETHVVRKNNILYYAFYAPEWNGEIEFRGLDDGKEYLVEDYVNHNELGKINGSGTLKVEFKEYLLVRAMPQ